MTRVAIFVDTQNVYYTVREAYGKHFDYRRFWAQATANREVVAAPGFWLGFLQWVFSGAAGARRVSLT